MKAAAAINSVRVTRDADSRYHVLLNSVPLTSFDSQYMANDFARVLINNIRIAPHTAMWENALDDEAFFR